MLNKDTVSADLRLVTHMEDELQILEVCVKFYASSEHIVNYPIGGKACFCPLFVSSV